MRKRYSLIIIIVFLIALISILECFTEKEKAVVELPVAIVTSCEYLGEQSEVHVNLFEINSKKRCAKMINNEIRDIFEKRANEHIEGKENFIGNYTLASEYSINQNILSLKIYETDSNEKNTSGNIYAVVYDIRNDCALNLSTVLNNNKLDYNTVIESAREFVNEKNDNINTEFPYFYINDKGNIELIARSIIQVDKYEFWNNIEIYECIVDNKDDKNLKDEN